MLPYIESQILSNFEVNKYQIRQLLDCLTLQKPHYKILKYFKQDRQSNRNMFVQDTSYSTNIFLNFEVYDENEKINKFLQIFLFNTYSSSQQMLFICQNLVKRVQSFGQSNLILQPLDSYLLQEQKITWNSSTSSSSSLSSTLPYSDFFVVEFEAFDLTLSEYCSTFGVNDDQISDLVKSQRNYIKSISQIEFYFGERFSYENTYIKVDDSQQIRLKLNLIPRSRFDEIHTEYAYSQNKEQINKKPQKMTQNNNLNEELSQNWNLSEEKRRIIEENTQEMKDNNFTQLREKLLQQIHKYNLIGELPLQNPKIYQYHRVEIFEIISKHTKYTYFEIIEINSQKFIFKIIKNDGNYLYLEGKKYFSLDEAQQLQQQYQKLIDTSQTKSLTTLTSSELILTDNGDSYILLERNNNQKNFISFQESKKIESKDGKQDFGKQFIMYLEKLVQLSYTLFTQHQIQITTINPFKIVLQENEEIEENIEGRNKIFELNIQDFHEGEYSFEYVKILENYLGYQCKNIEGHVKLLFQQFFKAISERNTNQFEITYQEILRFIKKSTELTNLEKEAKQSQFKVLISFADSPNKFEDLEILIGPFIFNQESIKSFQNLLNSHSFTSVTMNKTDDYKEIFQYKNKNEKNDDAKYGLLNIQSKKKEENVDGMTIGFSIAQEKMIQSFFFGGENKEVEQNYELVQTLNDLMKIYEMEVDISVENYSLKDSELVFLAQEMEAENQQNLAMEVLRENQSCLKLSFSPLNSNNESCAIRIFQKEKKIIILLCESPFIVEYQASIHFYNIEYSFLRAEWYQNLKSLLPENAQIPTNSYGDLSFLQLCILQNSKNLTQLKDIYLSPKQFLSNYQNYSQLLSNHHNLQTLRIKCDNNTKKGFSNNPSINRDVSIKLKECVSKLKNLNTLEWDFGQKLFSIQKLYQTQLLKLPRLVNLIKIDGQLF